MDTFLLPVSWQGKEIEFPAQILTFGYGIKLEVEIDEIKIWFERDEQANWRGVMAYEDVQAGKKVDRELIQAIAATIEKITG